jgi:hypothetical protein
MPLVHVRLGERRQYQDITRLRDGIIPPSTPRSQAGSARRPAPPHVSDGSSGIGGGCASPNAASAADMAP